MALAVPLSRFMSRVGGGSAFFVRLRMTLTWNRILSGLLAASYVVIGLGSGSGETALKALVFVILPLACIWFSEPMGGFTGLSGNIWITAPSPSIFVCIAGWLLLVLPLIFMIL